MRFRAAGAAGVAYVGLVIVGNDVLASGSSPDLHDSPERYAEAAAVHASDRGVVGTIIVVLGLLGLIVFTVALADAVRSRGGSRLLAGIVLGGGFATAGVQLAEAGPIAAVSVLARDGELTPVLAKALMLQTAVCFIVAWSTTAVYVGAAALSALREGTLPRKLGLAGLAISPLLLLGAATVWVAPLGFIAWTAALVWIVVTSVMLAVRPHAAGCTTRGGYVSLIWTAPPSMRGKSCCSGSLGRSSLAPATEHGQPGEQRGSSRISMGCLSRARVPSLPL